MILVLMSLCTGVLCGCAYIEDRARDAGDMITLAGELGSLGVSAWVGCVGGGLMYAGGYGFGLRSGAVGSYEYQEATCVPPFAVKHLTPGEADRARGKGYLDGIPVRLSGDDDPDFLEAGWFNLGQVEVSVAFPFGPRVGLNIFEIADFLLGWTTLDICNDDVASRRKPPPAE
jgi:hypothetical protein